MSICVLLLFCYLRVCHISVSWWSFTLEWVTTSLLKSSGLFSVSWPIWLMLWFELSPLVLLFPSPLVILLILYDCTMSIYYKCYYSDFHVPQFFQFPSVMFWPDEPVKNAIPRWCTGRKWHILMVVMRGNRVGGNWLMKWDEVKKIPLYSHRLTHRKRVTSELHDSYFRSMTITQAIPKVAEVTHPGR